MEEDLKPCPFCGSPASRRIIKEPWSDDAFLNHCTNCRGNSGRYISEKSADSAWNCRADAIKAQLPQPKRKRDDYVLVVRVYLDYEPGYAHELRPDHPEDIAALQGSIDGELDGADGEIRVLWPDYPGGFVPYQHRSTVIERAGTVFRDLQQRQAHGRIVIHFGDHDVMWLTEWILKAEWAAAEEFTGW